MPLPEGKKPLQGGDRFDFKDGTAFFAAGGDTDLVVANCVTLAAMGAGFGPEVLGGIRHREAGRTWSLSV